MKRNTVGVLLTLATQLALLGLPLLANASVPIEHVKIGAVDTTLIHSNQDDEVVLEAVIHVGTGNENTEGRRALELALHVASLNGNSPIARLLLQERGATIESGSDAFNSWMRLTTKRQYFGDTLPLFISALRRPIFNGDDVGAASRDLISMMQDTMREQPRARYGISERLVFGKEHPLSRAMDFAPAFAQLPRLDVEDLHTLYSRWVRPDNLTLMLTGDLSAPEARAFLEPVLEDWRNPNSELQKPISVKEIPQPAAPRVFLVDSGTDQRACIETMSLFDKERLADRDRAALEMLTRMLSGYDDSRIDIAIGSIKPKLTKQTGEALSLVGQQALVKTEVFAAEWNVPETMQEMRQAMAGLAGALPPSAQQIAALHNEILDRFRTDDLPTRTLAAKYHELAILGLPDTEYETARKQLEKVTPEAIQAAARHLGLHSPTTWIVYGNAARLEPLLRRLLKQDDFGSLTLVRKGEL
jgi:zinc protease